jgi:hypothetical protein
MISFISQTRREPRHAGSDGGLAVIVVHHESRDQHFGAPPWLSTRPNHCPTSSIGVKGPALEPLALETLARGSLALEPHSRGPSCSSSTGDLATSHRSWTWTAANAENLPQSDWWRVHYILINGQVHFVLKLPEALSCNQLYDMLLGIQCLYTREYLFPKLAAISVTRRMGLSDESSCLTYFCCSPYQSCPSNKTSRMQYLFIENEIKLLGIQYSRILVPQTCRHFRQEAHGIVQWVLLLDIFLEMLSMMEIFHSIPFFPWKWNGISRISSVAMYCIPNTRSTSSRQREREIKRNFLALKTTVIARDYGSLTNHMTPTPHCIQRCSAGGLRVAIRVPDL